jgi:hypothetical protein
MTVNVTLVGMPVMSPGIENGMGIFIKKFYTVNNQK